MMGMWICEDCKEVYEELRTAKEKHPYGQGYVEEEIEIYECDCCGGDLVEAKCCPICDYTIIPKDEDICEDCIKEGCTLENCLEMGNDTTEEYDINGFLASVYSLDEVIECLLADFSKMPQHMQQEYIENYCKEDKWFFTDFLERKAKE
jgi:RecJ-like exonuclease